MPPELARKSQPSRTRPTSKNASAVLAAMLSVCDSNGCDDSVDWTDMVFPLDVYLLLSPSIESRWAEASPLGETLRSKLTGPDDSRKGPCDTTGLEHRQKRSVEGALLLHYGASPSN